MKKRERRNLIILLGVILFLALIISAVIYPAWLTGNVFSASCSVGKIEIGTGSARWLCTDYNNKNENLDCYGGNNPPNTYLDVETNGWKCGRWG